MRKVLISCHQSQSVCESLSTSLPSSGGSGADCSSSAAARMGLPQRHQRHGGHPCRDRRAAVRRRSGICWETAMRQHSGNAAAGAGCPVQALHPHLGELAMSPAAFWQCHVQPLYSLSSLRGIGKCVAERCRWHTHMCMPLVQPNADLTARTLTRCRPSRRKRSRVPQHRWRRRQHLRSIRTLFCSPPSAAPRQCRHCRHRMLHPLCSTATAM